MQSGFRHLLASGAVKLQAQSVSFVNARVRPGLVHIRAQGADDGELGHLPVSELRQELERFPLATDVFVDASSVTGVSASAREHWEYWLAQRDHRLRALHLLSGNRQVQWTAEVAAHRAHSPVLFVHKHPASFAQAWSKMATSSTPSDRLRSLRVERVQTSTTLRLSDGRCRVLGDVLNARTRLVRIFGTDQGTLTTDLFDWLCSPAAPTNLRVLFDLQHVHLPPADLAQLWTTWLSANRPRLSGVILFSPSRAMRLVLEIARHLSRVPDLVSVVDDYAAFREAMTG